MSASLWDFQNSQASYLRCSCTQRECPRTRCASPEKGVVVHILFWEESKVSKEGAPASLTAQPPGHSVPKQGSAHSFANHLVCSFTPVSLVKGSHSPAEAGTQQSLYFLVMSMAIAVCLQFCKTPLCVRATGGRSKEMELLDYRSVSRGPGGMNWWQGLLHQSHLLHLPMCMAWDPTQIPNVAQESITAGLSAHTTPLGTERSM